VSALSTGTIPPAEQLGRVHFIGIGGAGMSGIARILRARGIPVSGSDAKDSRTLSALRALGAEVHVGHRAEHVVGADTVVVSTAIRETNVELVAARAGGARIIHRAQALAATTLGRRLVAVAGTHGKTTTSSMLTITLQACGADPSFAIGGNLNESGVNAHDGSGELFVVEADESDGSFLGYAPEIAVVTNVEADHLDHYGTAQAVHEAFDAFARLVPDHGALVVCADDPGSRALGDRARAEGRRVRTYGTVESADLRVDHLDVTGPTSRWDAVWRGRRLGPVAVSVPGRHNALNSAAVLAVALELGLPFADARAGIERFVGTRRRFEAKGAAFGVRVFDDYAHHPTEIAATLAAARAVVGEGRLVVAFQPHRYSRTQAFRAEFGQALAAADEVVVMEVYSAGEDPIPGASGAAVAAAVPLPDDRVSFEPSWSSVPGWLASRANPGDLVLTLGAGDVTMLGPEVVELLREREVRGAAG
jgi:UDP-N-acetylmuramate--alanine ligase